MFRTYFKKLMLFAATIMLAIGCAGIHAIQASAASTVTVGDAQYTIISDETGTAAYVKPASKSLKTASIPDTVKIGQRTCNVTAISSNAFKGNKKIKKVTIGNNVETIGKNAFYNCKNLKTVIIKTTKLSKSSVGAKAFKGLHAKAVVTVPSEKLAVYKEVLKSRGLTGKNQKVKSDKTTGSTTNTSTWSNYDSSQPLPEPKTTAFTIGDCLGNNAAYVEAHTVTDSAEYSTGDDIPFTVGLHMNSLLYGDWKEEKSKNKTFLECYLCRKDFITETMLGMHLGHMGCDTSRWLWQEADHNLTFNAWNFYPSTDPCKVVYTFTLPDGLSYKEDGVKVNVFKIGEIKKNKYHVAHSGNKVTVTIDDIKSEPFSIPFNKAEYDKNPYAYESSDYEGRVNPITVLLNTNFNGHTQAINTISASVTYSYKGNEKTIDLGDRNVYAASVKINNTDTEGNLVQGSTFTLYREETVFPEGSSFGTYEWKKIKSGLKSGDIIKNLAGGYYKIEQDVIPDGYKEYYGKGNTTEFEVSFKKEGNSFVLSAKDDNHGDALDVIGDVVQVYVKNKKDESTPNYNKNLESENPAEDINTETESVTKDSNSKTENTVTTNNPENTSQSSKVTAIYYKDSVKDATYIYPPLKECTSNGMFDVNKVPSFGRSYAYKNCKLEKITLNGEEIDEVPDLMEYGSVICFYYVTND